MQNSSNLIRDQMAQYPYIATAIALRNAVERFKAKVPSDIDSATLQKMGLAAGYESFLINIFKFLNLVDEKGKATPEALTLFSLHSDPEFKENFSKTIKNAYKDLFDLNGEATWGLSNSSLITFFRKADQSSDITGQRQAKTFETLASIAGKRDSVDPTSYQKSIRNNGNTGNKNNIKRRVRPNISVSEADKAERQTHATEVGLTVRIEINLPSDGNKETYDTIFKSIRENLLNG